MVARHMINFRFHIVSLTAVLLALGIGLVLGTAFLDDALISTLRTQLDGLEGDLERERERGSDQRVTIGRLEGEHEALDGELGAHVLAGSLEDQPVLLITREGVEDDLVDRAMQAFEQADADVVGAWELQEALAADDDDAIERLGEALDVSTGDGDRLRDNVTGQLSDVLYGATDADSSVDDMQSLMSQEPGAGTGDEEPGQGEEQQSPPGATEAEEEDGGVPEPHEPVLLGALHEAGLVQYHLPEDSDTDVVLLPGERLRVVVIDGFGADAPDSLLYMVLDNLAANGPVPVVVAGPSPTDDSDDDGEPDQLSPLVERVREDELVDRVSTVDNLDRAPGQVAVVLAAAAAQPSRPHIGHYGQGDGTEQLLPPPGALPERDG
jgi:hypothetical protein